MKILSLIYYLLSKIYSFLIKTILKNKVILGRDVLFLPPSFIISGGHKNSIVIGDRSIIGGFLILDSNMNGNGNGKIVIGKYSHIGNNTTIRSMTSIQIGNNVLISSNVYILDHNSHSTFYKDRRLDIRNNLAYRNPLIVNNIPANHRVVTKPIIIGDDVWIGRNSLIMKGVSIGPRSVVAAGSVVVHDAPPNSIIAGNPAKVVKRVD